MTIFRCMVLFILLLIPVAATGEPTAGPTVVIDQYTHPVALNWYHEGCKTLVQDLTTVKNDVVAYLKTRAEWLEKVVVVETYAWAEECTVSCQDPTGQLWKKAERYRNSVRGQREAAKQIGETMQGWIDFMGKCIKSIEKSGP